MYPTGTKTTKAVRTCTTRSTALSRFAGLAREDERLLGMKELTGSTPVTGSDAGAAQWLCAPLVRENIVGSIPTSGSINKAIPLITTACE
jgi:hypothetical protein